MEKLNHSQKNLPSNRNTVKLYLGLHSDRPATNTLSYDMALKSKVLPTDCSQTNVLLVQCGPEMLHLNGHLVYDKRLLNIILQINSTTFYTSIKLLPSLWYG